jgi:hypothetical protein
MRAGEDGGPPDLMTDESFDHTSIPGARKVEIGPVAPAQRAVVLAPRRLLGVVALLVVDDRRDDAEPQLIGLANEAQLRDVGEGMRLAPVDEGSMYPIGPPGPPQQFIADVALDGARALVSILEDAKDARRIADGITEQQARKLGDACIAVADWLHAHARCAPCTPSRTPGGIGSEPDPDGVPGRTLRERLSRMAGWQDRLLAARPEERTGLLLAFGLSAADIARVVPGLDTRSEPARGARVGSSSEHDRLYELCALLGYAVANATYDEAAIVSWLRAGNTHLGDRCPLDVLRHGNLQAVRDAWELAVEIVAVDDADLFSLPGRRRRRLIRWPRPPWRRAV